MISPKFSTDNACYNLRMTVEINPRMLQAEPLRRCTLGTCRAACCLHGVWISIRQVEDILAHAELIRPHMPAALQDPAAWLDEREETDPFQPGGRVRHSNVLPDREHYGGTACVFLRADYKCALQVAGDANGLHAWRFKPFYCILHPLDLDESGRITLDETELLLDEPASCLRAAEEQIPLAVTFEPELRYFLGDEGYEDLLKTVTRT